MSFGAISGASRSLHSLPQVPTSPFNRTCPRARRAPSSFRAIWGAWETERIYGWYPPMRLAPMCDCLAAPAHLVARALPYRWGRAGPKLVGFAGEVSQIGRKGNEIWNVLSRPPFQGEKPQLVWSRNVRILTLSSFSLLFRPICGMRVPSSRLVPSFSTHPTHRRRVLL